MGGGTNTFLGRNRSPIKETIGSHIAGTIQSSTLSSPAILADDDVRVVMVQTQSETEIEIIVTLNDTSTITHRIFGGSYILDLEYNQSPIVGITAREIDGVSTRVVINWVNKRL